MDSYNSTNSIRVDWRARNLDFEDDPNRQPWLHCSPLLFPTVAAALGMEVYDGKLPIGLVDGICCWVHGQETGCDDHPKRPCFAYK